MKARRGELMPNHSQSEVQGKRLAFLTVSIAVTLGAYSLAFVPTSSSVLAQSPRPTQPNSERPKTSEDVKTADGTNAGAHDAHGTSTVTNQIQTPQNTTW